MTMPPAEVVDEDHLEERLRAWRRVGRELTSSAASPDLVVVVELHFHRGGERRRSIRAASDVQEKKGGRRP